MTRLLLVIAVASVFLIAPVRANASSHCPYGDPCAPWKWEPGHAWWGYNHVTPTINRLIAGPANYWYDYHLHKLNGDGAVYGFYSYTTNEWCIHEAWSDEYHIMYAPGLGCGGYNKPYVGHGTGASSYVRADTFA
jgi:hypothetical protein